MYIYLRSKMCKELEALEEKYRTGAEMSEGDLRRIDLLTHSMKSLETYIAMKEAEEYRNNQTQPQNQMPGQMQNQNYSYAPNMSYTNNSYADNSYAQRGMSRGFQPYHQGEQRW